MSKTFCEFLVDSGTIETEVLVHAFIEQAKSNPSLPEIIRRNELLRTDQILEVYKHQATHHASFEESCRELGFWSEKLSLQIDAVIVKEVPSIFKSLIEADYLTFSDITIKLDEYIAMVIENPEDFGLNAA